MGKKKQLPLPAEQVATSQVVNSTVTKDQDRDRHAKSAADLLDLIARLIANAIHQDQQPKAGKPTKSS